MSAPNAKGGNGIVVRFQRPTRFPDLIRFADNDDLEKLEKLGNDQDTNSDGQRVPYMYFETEEVKEEEDEDDDDDKIDAGHTYQQKKKELQRRYAFRPKQSLCLKTEDKSLNLQGRIGNTDLADSEDISKNKAYRMKKSMDDFQYCLFEFVEREQDGVIHKEIHVTPAGQMYVMRKDGSSAELLLNEVEERMDEEKKHQSKSILKKFPKAVNVLVHHGDVKQADDEGSNYISNKKKENLETDADRLLRIFDSTTSLMKKSSKKAGGGRGGNVGDSGTAGVVKLNDIGIDEEELKNEEFKGDYGGAFADDEENHVVELQRTGETAMVAELAGSALAENYDMIESDGEEEDDEAELAQLEKKKLAEMEAKGIVDDATVRAAQQSCAATATYREAVVVAPQRSTGDQVGKAGVMTKSALKNGRPREIANDLNPSKRSRQEGDRNGMLLIPS